MKMQNVPLDQIVWNPWRDEKLYPIDDDHVAELRESINDHGFFGGIKGRRRNGKVEIACGHMRIAAARMVKPRLESVPIFIDDLDDDAMLRLMTDENATQSGANPGAVMNEVGAVTRRLIEGLLRPSTIVEALPAIKAAFETAMAMKQTIGRLRAGTDVHIALGQPTISRYLGQGDEKRSHRTEKQIRTAISALKQAGRYDEIVDEMLSKFPEPVAEKAKGKAVAKTERKPRRAPILDPRCANLFPNEHQFDAFREAVTTDAAKKVLPVDSQYAVAKEIMGQIGKGKDWNKKQVGAPFIKKYIQNRVQEGMKKQRDINKEEKEAFMREQREARISSELHSAKASLRSLLSALLRLADLADQFPSHPEISGFAAKLDDLVDAIKQFSKKIK